MNSALVRERYGCGMGMGEGEGEGASMQVFKKLCSWCRVAGVAGGGSRWGGGVYAYKAVLYIHVEQRTREAAAYTRTAAGGGGWGGGYNNYGKNKLAGNKPDSFDRHNDIHSVGKETTAGYIKEYVYVVKYARKWEQAYIYRLELDMDHCKNNRQDICYGPSA